MTKAQCPENQILRQYVLGECPDEISDVVERHVEECPACEDTIAQFDNAADTLMRHLPLAAGAAQESRQPPAGWIDVLRGKPPAETPGDCPAKDLLGIVEPVEQQAMSQLADGFSNYQVLGVLGRGGMGVVFLARHKQLNRRVALKVVRPDAISSEMARRRFQREIQILGGLNHPGIVMATDAGIVGRGAYLVMEWIDGTDFGRLVRAGGPLTVESACEAGRQIAEALAAAHQGGVVHRDVKPSNTMVDTVGRVRLLDFGLAHMTRLIQESGDTSIGQLLGTLDYMAPEQAEGERQLDARADLYALGAMLFFLLTGRPPHGSRSGRSILEHIRAVSHDEAPRVSFIRVDVPRELDDLIARLLSRDPANRPQSATDVAMSLAKWAKNDLATRVADYKSGPFESIKDSADSIAARQSLVELLGDGLPSTGSVNPLPVAANSAQRPPSSRRRFSLWAAFGPLAILIAGVIVLLIRTPEGTLKIASEVDGISVEVVDEKARVNELTIKGGEAETTLTAGKYLIRIPEKYDGLKLDRDTISMIRGETTFAKVTRIPGIAGVEFGLKDETASDRLYQGKSETEWQRQFKLETEPKAKVAAAVALFSLAGSLTPIERVNRLLDIGEEVVRLGWGDRFLELPFDLTTPMSTFPLWQASPSPEFQKELLILVETISAKDLAPVLLKAIRNGNDHRAALAAYLLSFECWRALGKELEDVFANSAELDVPFTGFDRSALFLIVRSRYLKKLDGDRRIPFLERLKELASFLEKEPPSPLRSRFSETLFNCAEWLYGTDFPKGLEQSVARLVLRQMLSNEFGRSASGFPGVNYSGFKFNVVNSSGGGGMGSPGAFERDFLDTYDADRISQLRAGNRHLLNAWVGIVNDYLQQAVGKPSAGPQTNSISKSGTDRILLSIDVMARIQTQADDWPINRTSELLTDILHREYNSGPDSKDTESSALARTLLPVILRITGTVPDFVRVVERLPTNLRNDLGRLQQTLKDAHEFVGKGDSDFPNWNDSPLAKLLDETPYQAIKAICESKSFSTDFQNAVGLRSYAEALDMAFKNRKWLPIFAKQGPTDIDPVFLLAIFADLAGNSIESDSMMASIIGDQAFHSRLLNNLRQLADKNLRTYKIAEQSIQTIAEKTKSSELQRVVQALLHPETLKIPTEPVTQTKPENNKTKPKNNAAERPMPSNRLYQGKSESEWESLFVAETDPGSKLEAAFALLSLGSNLPASKRLERILDIGETIVEAGWESRSLEFAFERTHTTPLMSVVWKLEMNSSLKTYLKYQQEIIEQIGRIPGPLLAEQLSSAALKGNDARAAFAISMLRYAAKWQIASDKIARQTIWTAFDVPLTEIDRSFLYRVIQLDYLRDGTQEQRDRAFELLKEMSQLVRKSKTSRLSVLMGGKLLTTARSMYASDWPADVAEELARLVLRRSIEPNPSPFPLEGGFKNTFGFFGGSVPMFDDEVTKQQQTFRESARHFLDAWVKVVNEYLEQHQNGEFDAKLNSVIRSLDGVLSWYSEEDKWPVEKTSQLLTTILATQYDTADEQNFRGNRELAPQTVFSVLSNIVILTGELPKFVREGRDQSKTVIEVLTRLQRQLRKLSPADASVQAVISSASDPLLSAVPYESFKLLCTEESPVLELWYDNFVRNCWDGNFKFNPATHFARPLLMAMIADLSGKDAEIDERISMILDELTKPDAQFGFRPTLFEKNSQTHAEQVTNRLMQSIVTKSKNQNLIKLIREMMPADEQDLTTTSIPDNAPGAGTPEPNKPKDQPGAPR